jgi:hypothetical protein
MQKVEGSNPFSRFKKGLHLQDFFVETVGLCVCFAPDRNRTRGKLARTFDSKKPPFAGNSGSFELLTSCEGDAEGHEFDRRASPVSVRTWALRLRARRGIAKPHLMPMPRCAGQESAARRYLA